jgi:hypothetical protein
MEALRSSETSVLTRATRRNIPEGTIFHSHRRENLKSYLIASFLSIKMRNITAADELFCQENINSEFWSPVFAGTGKWTQAVSESESV